MIVVIVVIIVIAAAGVNDANNKAKAEGISASQFHGEPLGTSQEQVEQDLGKPEDSQEFTSRGIITKTPQNSSCIYYHQKGYGLFEGKSYQLCFENGKLDSKNAY